MFGNKLKAKLVLDRPKDSCNSFNKSVEPIRFQQLPSLELQKDRPRFQSLGVPSDKGIIKLMQKTTLL